MKIIQSASLPTQVFPFLASVEQGNDQDLRTPLFGGSDVPRDEIANKWAEILFNLDGITPELADLELSQKSKMGTMSVRLPYNDRVSNIVAYYESANVNAFTPLSDLNRGVLNMTRQLTPMTSHNSVSHLPGSTNSGLPLFKRRSTVVSESLALAEASDFFGSLLGWRGQSNGTNIPKQRVVWMFPFSTNIMEYRYFAPLHSVLRERSPFSAWVSMDEVDKSVTRMFDAANSDSEIVMSTDFSHYDQSLLNQQKWFFQILTEAYHNNEAKTIDKLANNFRTIPMVATRNHTYTGEHGVPSGSVFTGICDSIVNYIMQYNSPFMVNELLQIQGDDAVVTVDDVGAHIRYLESHGFTLNQSKQYVNEKGVMYLQRLHSSDYRTNGIMRGIYPTFRALNSLVGQERFHKDWDETMVSLRTISILENCRNHPNFKSFLKFVVKEGDSHLLDNLHVILKTPLEYINRAKAIPGFTSTFNTSPISGLSNFTTVRLLQDL